MTIIPGDASRDATGHPAWCDRSRCQYPRLAGSKFGAHRSAPMTLGRVTAVIVLDPRDGRPYLDVRTTTRLIPVEGDAGRLHAIHALMATDAALAQCTALASEWQNDHSMRASHAVGPMSTPNAGGAQW